MLECPDLPPPPAEDDEEGAVVLHRYTSTEDAAISVPALVVVCEKLESPHPALLNLAVHHRVIIRRQETAVEAAENWVAAILEHQADTDAFTAFLLGLDEETERKGWMIHRLIQPREADHSDNAQQQTRTWEITVRMLVQIR